MSFHETVLMKVVFWATLASTLFLLADTPVSHPLTAHSAGQLLGMGPGDLPFLEGQS